MKRFFILILSILSLNLCFAQSQQRENLKKDVYYLSSDALEGRKVGSIGNSLAREYICSQLDSLKIEYYIQNFAVDLGNNIVAEIRAEKPLYNSEYIVIGAHYDHLGIKNNKIYNGADDNASGSAMLIQLARLLNANSDKINRNIILIWFDAEEMGLLGSDHFAYNPMFVD
ncbi:MAG: M28 family peptidase, partial [Bacteroidales bacterium]|nr:M28 family peptidase [Bacteroidales bacterium]